MNEQDDFMTPEEIQAKANSAKINRFVGSIGWQLLILAIVVYATVMGNVAADWMLDAYACVVAVSGAAFLFVTMRPLERLIINPPPRAREMLIDTPTTKVIRAIGTTFSIVEISLMVSYGFFFVAALWALTEIFQYTAAIKLRAALSHPLNDDSVEVIEIVEFEEVLAHINTLIEMIESDKTIDEASRDTAVELLKEERAKLLELHKQDNEE